MVSRGGGGGVEDDGLHREGKSEDKGLDALGKDGVAAVEDDHVNKAGEEEEEVEREQEKDLRPVRGKSQSHRSCYDGQEYLRHALNSKGNMGYLGDRTHHPR